MKGRMKSRKKQVPGDMPCLISFSFSYISSLNLSKKIWQKTVVPFDESRVLMLRSFGSLNKNMLYTHTASVSFVLLANGPDRVLH